MKVGARFAKWRLGLFIFGVGLSLPISGAAQVNQSPAQTYAATGFFRVHNDNGIGGLLIRRDVASFQKA